LDYRNLEDMLEKILREVAVHGLFFAYMWAVKHAIDLGKARGITVTVSGYLAGAMMIAILCAVVGGLVGAVFRGIAGAIYLSLCSAVFGAILGGFFGAMNAVELDRKQNSSPRQR
jgi:hypothetical protein